MLRREIAATRFADVIVDVGRIDRMRICVAVHILEQVLAGQLLKLADNPPKRAVGDRHLVQHAALAVEAHLHLATVVVDLAAKQGGGSETLVGFRIFLIAHAQIFVVEQADDRGDDLLLAQRALAKVLVNLAPDLGKRVAEFSEATELARFGAGAEVLVVAILLAAAVIDSRRLQVTVWILAEPGMLVGRWKGD